MLYFIKRKLLSFPWPPTRLATRPETRAVHAATDAHKITYKDK